MWEEFQNTKTFKMPSIIDKPKVMNLGSTSITAEVDSSHQSLPSQPSRHSVNSLISDHFLRIKSPHLLHCSFFLSALSILRITSKTFYMILAYISMSCLGVFLRGDQVKSFVEDWLKAKSQPDAGDSFGDQNSSSPDSVSAYLSLPDNLRACLNYSSFLTWRYSVDRDELVRLLVAEGLVVQDDSGNLLEDSASGVVEELVNLQMLRHDLLERERLRVPSPYRELCVKVVTRKEFVAAAAADLNIRLNISDDGKEDLSPDLESLPVQSLFVITAERQGLCKSRQLSCAYIGTICRLKSLVVLDLDGRIECLPAQVGDLAHLKYLSLCNSYLKELPPTIGKLQNLQTLVFELCRLEELPVEVLEIQQLRHLIMSKSTNNCEIRVPKKIGEMKNLQTLCGVYAGGGIAGKLSELTQLLKLKVLRVAADHVCELSAAIMKMKNLISLSMEAESSYFDGDNGYCRVALFPEMETFLPPPLLQEVNLIGQLVEMPNWLVSMENLTKIWLSFSDLPNNPTSEIQFLPNLKDLTLWEAWKGKLIGKEFCVSGGFPKLETLKIASSFLVEWTEVSEGAFPSLESLILRNCTRFRFFPTGLQNISSLKLLWVLPIYDEDLKRRLKGEENYKIKNIPIVKLTSMPR